VCHFDLPGSGCPYLMVIQMQELLLIRIRIQMRMWIRNPRSLDQDMESTLAPNPRATVRTVSMPQDSLTINLVGMLPVVYMR
jgi:hypothetical protein